MRNQRSKNTMALLQVHRNMNRMSRSIDHHLAGMWFACDGDEGQHVYDLIVPEINKRHTPHSPSQHRRGYLHLPEEVGAASNLRTGRRRKGDVFGGADLE